MSPPRARHLWFTLVAAMALVCIVVAVVISVLANRPPSGVYGLPETWNTEVRQRVRKTHDRALDLMDKQQFAQAFRLLNDHLEQFPLDPVGHSLLARLYLAQHQPDQALQQARQSLQLNPDQPDMLMFAASLSVKKGQFDQAIEYYRKAEKLRPTAPQYPLWLANTYLKVAQFDQARLAALRTIHLAPRQHEAYAILAEASARQGHLNQALEQIDKALVLCDADKPAHLQYVLRKAAWLRRSNQPQRALDLLKMIDDTQRSTPEVGEQLAQTFLMLSQPAQAADVWTRVYDAHPGAAPAAEAGLCYLRAGDIDKARQFYTIAGSHMPEHPKVQALKKALEQANALKRKP